MSPSLLEQIESPADLKTLSDDELAVIAAEIRLRLIQVTSQNGGHLASSLGATDIIVAMHAVYNAPADQLVFDTGHQAYAHKLLTGRQADFSSLRQFKGLSGFIRRNESPYDTHDSGHASDALSIAMGLVLARDLSGGEQRVVALVGDAAVSGGMAFEALNQVGHEGRDITIILNDNEMSIAHNVGALSLYLAKVRSS
ncbi:MAG: 1-deoxy-D-xylulose-5-phosphate synthase, partial [Coriobacteriales bacterium]|nr:1-deoxy-D-xylulose-5-phosphate synthase [Coriobacteriales bacterium]